MRLSAKGFFLCVSAGVCLFLNASVRAHHSFATHYDASRSMELSGVVTSFDFRSPHSFIFVDVENENGDVTSWEVELHSVPVLTRMGFSATTFEPGDRITVNAWPNRSESNPLVFGIGVITQDGLALGEFPPIRNVQSAFLSAEGAARIQGRWQVPRPGEPTSFERPMRLTSAGEQAVANYDPQRSPANSCEPYNVPAAWLTPYLFDIRFDDRQVTIHHEAYDVVRKVPLGSEAGPLEATGWFGTGRARLDGDELVIETSGYPDSGWGLATAVDENGLGADIPSSTAKTVVERLSVSNDGLSLRIQYTVADPQYLTEPFTGFASLDRVADDSPMYDFECELDSAARFSRDP
jgi:hypothetical protein